MKQVFLKSMTLINFKGQKSKTIDFSQETYISGKNATGKSTIFDAFVWTLFGKDQFDRKDFEVIPTVDGKRLDRVDSEVSITLDIEGEQITLRRVLHQKWVRKRGTADEVFDGCDTLCYINDVPKKAGEYKAFIDGIIDETVFKLITNTSAFLGLHWTKQREFLFQIAGTISDNQIAESNPNFKLLLEAISGKSMADFKKELSARKRKLQEDLESINPKISQTQKLMPEPIDTKALKSELFGIDENIARIDTAMVDRSASIRGQYEDIQAKQKQINDLNTKQQEVVHAAEKQAQMEAFNINQKRDELVNNLAKSKRKVEDTGSEISQLERAIGSMEREVSEMEAQITKLRNAWTIENETEYKSQEGCLICPVFGSECGDPNATGKHLEAQESAKKAFFTAKDKKLESINESGKETSKQLNEIKPLLEQRKSELESANDNLKALEAETANLQNEINAMPFAEPYPVIATELPEWQELEQQKKDIQATIQEAKPVDNSDLNEQKAIFILRRDEVKKQLMSQDLIEQYLLEIKNLTKQAGDISQQIANIEKQEFTMAAFTKAKIDECERRINGLFDLVKFQLFDKTIEGNEFECCIATNKSGVQIAATNTAEKVNAGLDIIHTLSKFYNISAPIFCDGSESVNEHFKTGSQMVFLKVTTEQILTIK